MPKRPHISLSLPIMHGELMKLLEQSAIDGELRGIRVCRGASTINHFLFANDSLIFCNASRLESEQLLAILQTYMCASGQYINREKTMMIFNKNVKEGKNGEIMAL